MRKKIRAHAAYALFLILILELTARLYWSTQKNIPFFEMRKLIYVYYPELKSVDDMPPNAGDDSLDILILDGSAMNPRWGDVPAVLAGEIGRLNLRKNIRIFNLAVPTHTSLDSLFKYSYLRNRTFGLVFLYHGINEVRANNCPPEVFRDDYSHYSWYLHANLLRRHREHPYLAFPFTAHNLFVDILQRAGFYKNILHREYVREEWAHFGSQIKTAGPFRKNMKAILDIAAEKKERLVLMSFASYLPADYTYEKFQAAALGYVGHKCPTEMWGRPENVTAGIAAHNEIIYELAREYGSGIVFIDQARLIPKEGRYFSDICHFSPQGSRKFVAGIIAEKEALFGIAGTSDPDRGGTAGAGN